MTATGAAPGVAPEAAPGVAPAVHFGQGHREPYALALQDGYGKLTLRPDSDNPPGNLVEFDVHGWCAEASIMERSLLGSLRGPVLDVGCGPGRLLAAAGQLGLAAMGIDTSAEAVRRACGRGVHALEQSIFAAVPHSGHWQSVILLDGNIGIGGGVTSLLRRCRQVIAPSGTLLVEVDAEDIDTAYSAVLEDWHGNRSEPFSWARTGAAGLMIRTHATGWIVTEIRHVQGRVFCWLRPQTGQARSIP
ncbi:methyltransferase domain-containing protein [Arthrobacter sp. ISL-48]|uniref:methyltransferase domain-containing protein n=1 Tax=Arthrobacter sp. ISL-48 TaxID=2819110 RepID=UPI001BE96793|nr:methyltransferase domain-containing protein [Arthrobacter sp. ISL-48]MBT2534278.1 methyltransferase domain-containing protein [Arthrobacter sp. ISL-48]